MRHGLRTRLSLALCVAAVVGCYSSGEGDDPDDKGLYFPVGVALSNSGKYLFVANSDFDLRYNSGTVQALDVPAILASVVSCEFASGKINLDGPTSEGCYRSDVSKFVRASVRVGAFAADVTAGPRYSGGGEPLPVGGGTGVGSGRLYVPVRGDATVTYIDYDESGDSSIKLTCYRGAGFNQYGHPCEPAWRLGQDAANNSRQILLEGEPFAVAVPTYWPIGDQPTKLRRSDSEPRRSGGLAAVVHQTSGDVSVFVNAALDGETPRLAFTLTGLPAGATGITPLDIVAGLDPVTHPFVPRFLVTNRTQATLSVVSFYSGGIGGGGENDVDRGGLVLSDVIPIPTSSTGYDTRGVVVDAPNPTDDEPYRSRPVRVFLTNRAPNGTLIIGRIDPSDGRLHFYDSLRLPLGPSRITRMVFDDVDSMKRHFQHTRIYINSFDGRGIVSYDPETGRLGNVFQGPRVARGPYAIAIDSVRRLAFTANFTDSALQVIDLSPIQRDPKDGLPLRDPSTGLPATGPRNEFYEQVVFTVGHPTKPVI